MEREGQIPLGLFGGEAERELAEFYYRWGKFPIHLLGISYQAFEAGLISREEYELAVYHASKIHAWMERNIRHIDHGREEENGEGTE